MAKAVTAEMSKEDKRAAKAAKKASKSEHKAATESTNGGQEAIQHEAKGNTFEALGEDAGVPEKKVGIITAEHACKPSRNRHRTVYAPWLRPVQE